MTRYIPLLVTPWGVYRCPYSSLICGTALDYFDSHAVTVKWQFFWAVTSVLSLYCTVLTSIQMCVLDPSRYTSVGVYDLSQYTSAGKRAPIVFAVYIVFYMYRGSFGHPIHVTLLYIPLFSPTLCSYAFPKAHRTYLADPPTSLSNSLHSPLYLHIAVDTATLLWCTRWVWHTLVCSLS